MQHRLLYDTIDSTRVNPHYNKFLDYVKITFYYVKHYSIQYQDL